VRLPGGRLLYNAGGSGDVWMNSSGSSTGTWTEYQTTLPAGYSRNLTYDSNTGRVVILGNEGTSTIVYADIDFGHSAGTYYQIVSRLTGQVIGTSNNTTDANIGNANVPDVELENAGAVSNRDTQYWHVAALPDGAVTLLNKSGGRAAEIWTGNATAGQQIGPVGGQQPERPLETHQESRRLLRIPVGQHYEPVSDRFIHGRAPYPGVRHQRRLAGVAARPGVCKCRGSAIAHRSLLSYVGPGRLLPQPCGIFPLW
jgi:hypothetical protein